MIDVRKAAQERAARQSKPIGSSFETERQREKKAVHRTMRRFPVDSILRTTCDMSSGAMN